MAILYDASILTGPEWLQDAVIKPLGQEGGTHQISDTVEPIEVQQGNPSRLQVNDTLTVEDTLYRVTGMQYFESTATLDVATYHNINGVVLRLVSLDDPSNSIRLLVPFDEYVPSGAVIKDITITMVETNDYWFWDRLNKNNNFTIDVKNDVVCFTTGTLIDTDRGPRPVHLLRVGDMIRTRDHGMQPLRWLGGRQLSAAELAGQRRLHPIRVVAGALGPGMPARDLMVSPQHRLLVRSAIAERMTGAPEVLIAAVHLLGHPGIQRVAADSVGYWHLMFDRHEIVFAEGAEAESLHLGPMALSGMSDDALAELRSLFPDLVQAGIAGEPAPTCRPIMRGKPVKKLIERQLRNFKPLVAAPVWA
ncbi:Hint domain-containing protein [Paracoccus alkenifer]|uniref:Hint domain-containing protein n=1 Tax=Paracoccus alkenifer TaxID=65735 RepID=A0A1H6JMW0_9RHOB|nr:Hint domain-containing protein [Paracoccus alkenifer]SEH63758.1 Hint domain-containing protein [Paracoccus alkenifer]